MLVAWPTEFPTQEAVEAFPGLLRGQIVTEKNGRIVYTAAGWAVKTFAFPDPDIAGPLRQPVAEAVQMSNVDLATAIEAAGEAVPPSGSAAALNPFLVSLLIAAARRLAEALLARFG